MGINKDFHLLLWEPFEDFRFIKVKILQIIKTFYFILIVIALLLIYAGCAGSWSPSEKEAVKLVKDYYLFYKNGKEIDAEVINMGEFVKECKCYPVKYRIIFSQGRSSEKTLYLFRNKSGNIEVREYKFGIK